MRDTVTNRRNFLRATLGASAVTIAGCLGDDDDEQTVSLTAGGAPSGSTQFGAWQGILRVMEEYSDQISLTVQETPGGQANLRIIDEGQIDVGGTSNIDIIQASNDEGDFADNPVDSMPYQGFRYAVMHIYALAREDTDIETYEDLRGQSVWPLPAGFSTRQPGEFWMQDAGLWDDMDIVELDSDDMPGALEEGRIDAVVAYGSSFENIPGFFTQAESQVALRVLEMGDEHRQVVEDNQLVDLVDIEPYGWDTDVADGERAAWLLDFQMFFDESISNETAKEMVELTAEHTDMVRESQPAFPEDAEGMAEVIIPDLPIHPGAHEAFEELGVANDDWTVP